MSNQYAAEIINLEVDQLTEMNTAIGGSNTQIRKISRILVETILTGSEISENDFFETSEQLR